MAKYRVTIASFQYRVKDVEANSPEEAEAMVEAKIEEMGEEYVNYYCDNPYDFGSYVVENEAFEISENDYIEL